MEHCHFLENFRIIRNGFWIPWVTLEIFGYSRFFFENPGTPRIKILRPLSQKKLAGINVPVLPKIVK